MRRIIILLIFILKLFYSVYGSCVVSVGNTTICRGGSAILSANDSCGGCEGEKTYSWNTGDTTQTIKVAPTVTTYILCYSYSRQLFWLLQGA
jgi:hypothetical protein